MTDRARYFFCLSLPVAVLLWSGLAAPRLYTSEILGDAKGLPEKPTLLFRTGNTSVWYTSADLLHPEALGNPGEYYQAMLFDVWPAGEGTSYSLQNLTWVVQIGRALALRNVDGQPLPGVSPGPTDTQELHRFLREFTGRPTTERGGVSYFRVDKGSAYRTRTGITELVAVAVKDPGKNRLPPELLGGDSLFAAGLRRALNRFPAGSQVSGIGLPFMPVSEKLGSPLSQDRSWRVLLDLVREHGKRFDRVVLGGFGLLPENRKATNESFRRAWTGFRHDMERQGAELEHEQIRLAALMLAATILGEMFRRRRFRMVWLAAAIVVSAAFPALITQIAGWTQPAWSAVSQPWTLWIKIILVCLTGLFLRDVVRFRRRHEEVIEGD